MRLMTAALVAAFSCLPASADTLPTYQAVVVKVTDGDSLKVRIPAWAGSPFETMAIRLAGIDTPETSSALAKCPEEIALGKAASAYAKTLLRPGDPVTIIYHGLDKYFRLDADVVRADGQSVTAMLLHSGKAFPYNGKTKRSYCP